MSEPTYPSDDFWAREVAVLTAALDRAWPGWFEATARRHTDADGNTEAVCVPIRAAAALLREHALAPDPKDMERPA